MSGGIALESCGNGIWRAPGACIVDRSGRKRLPIGFGGFDDVAATSVLVDKTQLIADVLNSGYAVTLFCRPRRFGKTLNMTTLKAFLEIPTDGRSRAPLFEGTDIWQADGGRYRQYQGTYPVVHMSMLAAKGQTWKDTYAALTDVIISEYARHRYVLESGNLAADDREYFERILSGTASERDYLSSLRRLAMMLRQYHHRDVVVLIDEYDAPIMAAYSAPGGGYYDEAVAFLKMLLTSTLKNSGGLMAFACLTGVQRISKESIFSDLNNMVVDTALSTEFDEHYGFTDAQVQALAAYLGYSDCMDEMREWYDGYRFGAVDVYNPWSVLNYLKQGCAADVYWGNTSGNDVIGGLMRSANTDTLEKIYTLMQPGGVVSAPLNLGVVFPDLGVRGNAIWSMLYLAGYLTTDDTSRPGMVQLPRRLRIPNLEIASLYHSEIIERFTDAAGGYDHLESFRKALIEGDEQRLNEELNRMLRDSLSSFDLVNENACHMLLMGLCFGMSGYADPISNREAGYGRYDIRLAPAAGGPDAFSFTPSTGKPLITIELKYVKADGALSDSMLQDDALRSKAVAAIQQIEKRSYDADASRLGAQGRVRWGIAFSGKRCVAVCERIAG